MPAGTGLRARRAGCRRPVRCGARGDPTVRRGLRDRCIGRPVRRGPAPSRTGQSRRGPPPVSVCGPSGCPRGGNQRRSLPGAGGRVPGRRPGVHARDRADRRPPRQSEERRGLSEAGIADARTVHRAVGAQRPHPGDRRPMPVRHRPGPGPLPPIPNAEGSERRLGAGRTVLARPRRPRNEGHPSGPGPTRPRAFPDPDHGLRGLLPHRRRHLRGHPSHGDPNGVPGVGGRFAGVLPDPDLRRRSRPARAPVRTVHQSASRGAPRHRHRRRIGAARGRVRRRAVALRRRPVRLRDHGGHLSGPRSHPGGGQGSRPSRGRGGPGCQGFPAHRRPSRPGGHGEAPRTGRPEPRRRTARHAVPGG